MIFACGKVTAYRWRSLPENAPSHWCIMGTAWAGAINPQCVGYFGPPANDARGLHIVLPGEEVH